MTQANPSIEDIKSRLAQLKSLHEAGTLSASQYDEARLALERQLVDLVLSGAVVAAAVPPATAPKQALAAAPRARPSTALQLSLGVLVLLLAGAGYLWKGTPALLLGGSPAAVAESQDAADHGAQSEQIAAMTAKLVARLKDHPEDADGWAMLARTYDVTQRHADALKAYEKAVALRKDDPALLADYADSLAVNNGNSLDGAPMQQIEKALKLDPRNLKALALAGSFAFTKQDYANAVKLWEKMVQIGPADNFFVKQIIPGIVEARKLAGMPPSTVQAPASVSAPAAAPGPSTVSGTVTLAPALAKQASPDDTVFVFARPADGSRMPLAILRRQVKDLPLQFTLDDSMAMSPATALSSASKVVVGARISKSGNAIPQAGDMQALTGAVSVGSANLKIEIKDVVKP